MKKTVIFILGILTGIVLTFVCLAIIGKKQNNNFTKLETPIEFNGATSFKVLQVLQDGCLANSEEKLTHSSYYGDPIVYILNDGQSQYYDDQIISVPKGKQALQVGTYKYISATGQRTVPVLQIPK